MKDKIIKKYGSRYVYLADANDVLSYLNHKGKQVNLKNFKENVYTFIRKRIVLAEKWRRSTR
jgi:hypothetical protein